MNCGHKVAYFKWTSKAVVRVGLISNQQFEYLQSHKIYSIDLCDVMVLFSGLCSYKRKTRRCTHSNRFLRLNSFFLGRTCFCQVYNPLELLSVL